MPDNERLMPNHIDVDAVIRRSRQRRAPRRVAVGLVGTLAAASVVGGGIFGVTQLGVASGGSASSGAVENGAQPAPVTEPAQGGIPAWPVCGSRPPAPTPRPDGLVAGASAGSASAHGTTSVRVTVTNTGPRRVKATAKSVLAVLVDGSGRVVSTTQTPDVTKRLTLLHGQSHSAMVTLNANGCHAKPLTGAYTLYGVSNLVIDGDLQVVSGSGSPIRIP